MQHRISPRLSFSKPLLLIIALFIARASFLSATPPLKLLDHQEVITEKTEKQAARAAKKKWKKERRKKVRNKKKARKFSNKRAFSFGERLLLSLLIGLGTLVALFWPVFALSLTLAEYSFHPVMIGLSMAILAILLFGIWLTLKVNEKGSKRSLKALGLTIIVLATLSLVTLSFVGVFAANASLWDIIFNSIIGTGILGLGVWVFIQLLN